MITRIQIKGLRALQYIDVELAPFQVLVGPNASGKSTFLDAVALVRDIVLSGIENAVRGNVRLGIPMRARDPRDLTWKRQGGVIQIALTARKVVDVAEATEVRRDPLVRYEMAIGTEGRLQISGENFWILPVDGSSQSRDGASQARQRELFPREPEEPQRPVVWPASKRAPKGWRKVVSKTDTGNDYFRSENSGWRNQFRVGPAKSALANLPEDETRFPTATWFKRWLMDGIHVFALDPGAMRLPAPAGSPPSLLPDGSNLAQAIHELEVSAPDRLDDWVDHLRTALPDLKTIRTRERPEDRARYLEMVYRNGLVAPSWLLSDGTLRMLALTLLAYLPDQAKLILIEEPENGIHPRALETVLQSLSSVYAGQVLCATHSPLLLSLVKPEHLLCFGKARSGAVDVVRGSDHPELRNWRATVHLGDLFAMGVLG